MKKSAILAFVLGSLALQSCFTSEARTGSTITASAPLTTPITNTFNGITIDTTVAIIPLFINQVDDEAAIAYGTIYQFDNGLTTEISVAVPYNCVDYNIETSSYGLIINEFIKSLNTEGEEAYISVNKKTLAGYNN